VKETATATGYECSDKHFEKNICMYNRGLHSSGLSSPELAAVALLALQRQHKCIQFLLDPAHLVVAASLLHPVAIIRNKSFEKLK
jgi:hypothetical protein